MASIIKANELQDFGGNSIITSDGAGNVTVNAAAMKNTPAFSAFSPASRQSIANGTSTAVILSEEGFNVGGAFNFSTYIFTTPSDGKYFFTGGLSMRNGNSDLGLGIFVNGADSYNSQSTFLIEGGSTSKQITNSKIYNLSSGDTVQMYINQSTGSSQEIQNDQRTFFTGFKLIGA